MLPQPVVFEGVATCDDRPPPPLGADTCDLLQECGYSAGDIDALMSDGVARGAPSPPS
jgi:crotonobetainyl-CoA:carnitine CoA-transferase CaiB-like acyl-CoA transferase